MKEQLLSTLETSKNYTLDVANAMPEKGYDFKPVETLWSFGELLHHIAYGILWWEANYIKKEKMGWDPPQFTANKQITIAYLEEAYGSLKDTISKQQLNDESAKGFYATLDHITHHRGQAVIYLRGKDIAPPEYTY